MSIGWPTNLECTKSQVCGVGYDTDRRTTLRYGDKMAPTEGPALGRGDA